MISFIVVGSLAIIGTVWQSRNAKDEVATLSGTTASSEDSHNERNGPTLSDLHKQVKALEDQIRQLRTNRQSRALTPASKEELVTYLRRFGSHRVVVSCIPDDIEAFQYANQIVNVLKAGNWDAQGPEVTKIFGDVRGTGINVYVGVDYDADTMSILLDGFAKANIPYQSRVTPSRAIPDSETVELFIGATPAEQEKKRR